jgi:G3E family GTPase
LDVSAGKEWSIPAALLVCGFLGAGKTTFIMEQLRSSRGRTAVLVNEFGDLGIDGSLIRSRGGIHVVEMPGGCICCSQQEGLVESVRTIAGEIRPDMLLIEPSGVAEASEVIKVLTDEPLLGVIRLDAVITIIDASTFMEFSEPGSFGSFFLDQVTNADLVIVNKTDLVSPFERERVARRLFDLNPIALLVETAFCQLETSLPSGRQRQVRSSGHFGLGMECVSIVPELPIFENQLEKFAHALSRGEFGQVFRSKGLLRVEGGRWVNLQFAGGTPTLTPFHEEGRSRITLIGFNLDRKRISEFLK